MQNELLYKTGFISIESIYVQYSHRLSGGEDGVRWCQMVSCLSDACSVVSDGVEWFQLLSGGEDCVGGSVIFNLQLCIYSVA
jgi:hypothetical protein